MNAYKVINLIQYSICHINATTMAQLPASKKRILKSGIRIILLYNKAFRLKVTVKAS